MTAWPRDRERRAIVTHLARCGFCRALVGHSRCRRDRALLDAADQLATDHALADVEREEFCNRAGRVRNVVAKRTELRFSAERTGTRR